MRIGIVGFGGVGRAFLKLVYEKSSILSSEGLNIKINYIVDITGGIYDHEGICCQNLLSFLNTERDISKYPNGGSKNLKFSDMMSNKDIDVLIEMTPTDKETGEPGMTHISEALKNNIHVVTSNKGPILLAYKTLNDLARDHNVQLAIGCTTGGALPSINSGIIDMAGSEILSIEGVLNGTTNYIINEMENKGVTYHEALKKAQASGIAETNPKLDVEGWDTASKLLILTNVLMKENKTLDDVSIDGITELTPNEVSNALSEGKKYKLLGRTSKQDGKIVMTVKLEKIDPFNALYIVDGKNKAVRYTSDTLGDLTVIGGASGVIPAGASVLRDIINIHRGYNFTL